MCENTHQYLIRKAILFSHSVNLCGKQEGCALAAFPEEDRDKAKQG